MKASSKKWAGLLLIEATNDNVVNGKSQITDIFTILAAEGLFIKGWERIFLAS
jgi:hypothetical protein